MLPGANLPDISYHPDVQLVIDDPDFFVPASIPVCNRLTADHHAALDLIMIGDQDFGTPFVVLQTCLGWSEAHLKSILRDLVENIFIYRFGECYFIY
jgi:hypothetical protein